MWDMIISVPDHCLSFYFPQVMFNYQVENISLRMMV